jgi:predicted aspartyl protease
VQVKQGRLNFTTVVDLPKGAPVLTGTFSIHGHQITILFDSGATHSFINEKTVCKLDLKWCHTKQAYMVATPGGKVASNQVALRVAMNLEGVDVILGMN